MRRLLFLLSVCAIALAQGAPDCGPSTFTFTAAGVSTSIGNSGNIRCTTWTLTYYSEGFSAVSIQLQTAPDVAGTPGTFTPVSSAVVTAGSNPLTSITQAFLIANVYAPWLNVAATVLTGTTGKLIVKVDGWRGSPH
jgi:hypothetical protein